MSFGARPPGHGPAHVVIGNLAERDGAERIPTKKLRKLVPYFRPYRWQIVTTMVLMIFVSLAGLAAPALAQIAIDDGIRKADKAVLVWAVLGLVGAGIVGWLAGYGQSYLSAAVGERLLFDLRRDVFAHLIRLPLGYHERIPTGVTISRLTSDIEALNQLVTEGITTLVVQGITFFGVIAILFAYDWRLALWAFAVFPVLILATAVFRSTSASAYRRTRERIAHVLAVLQESLSGVRVVQGFGRQRAAADGFQEANASYREANMQTIHISAAYFPAVEFLTAIGTALVLFVGGKRVLDGDLTVGVLVAFLGYVVTFFDPIQSLSQLYGTFQSAMAALEKILGVLETEAPLDDRRGATELPPMRGEITLTDVTFAYREEPVLRDVNLTIRAGETVALVGPTGAGKSTLAKLIARFYDPTSGTVAIDGHDLRTVTQRSLRAQLGIVPQEGHLFSGTIAENLRFANPEATDDQLRAACAAVGALEFIDTLPDGLDTQVEARGTRLSAGQRQLVSFARALVADPRLLILDEATSSVDLRTEAHIDAAMERLRTGRTAIVIAHRLSTVRRADRIVVVEHGRIVEQGTHEELLARKGHYFALLGDWESIGPESQPAV
ncbi:MAG TPA: ABC transporter ATP-binding protein [Miltoncostaeales bacterium]|jgi:ATP-binding cassette subfamily B protein|nr:ABC transporter ATP-binding protein [Miltoncostaeales bacterium]